MENNKTEYMRNYMKEYNKNDKTLQCVVCGGSYKQQNIKKHERTNKHTLASNKELIIQNQINKLNNELNLIKARKLSS